MYILINLIIIIIHLNQCVHGEERSQFHSAFAYTPPTISNGPKGKIKKISGYFVSDRGLVGVVE